MPDQYNEFVGNAAVSVHGFGSCYWLLGTAVSGASLNHQFDGLAGYNTASAQAPLLRFRGNSCMTRRSRCRPRARSHPVARGPGDELMQAKKPGFTALANPCLTNGANVAANYARPIVTGNFLPAFGFPSESCSVNAPDPNVLLNNRHTCVTTVLDRFSTSFNWAEINLSAIWLRPWYYLFAIYGSTRQPASPSGGNNIAVVDAAIGWKQRNGFYYPPAFDYRRTSFLKSRSDSLNMCLTAAPGDYQSLRCMPRDLAGAIESFLAHHPLGRATLQLTTKHPVADGALLVDAHTVVTWDVTQDVMSGVASWLVRLEEESRDGEVTFYSEEGAQQAGDPALGPILILE